jgi:RNA polymerase sigma-70 factor (ECF subfamily)
MDLTELSDAELMAAFYACSRAAYEELLRRWYDRIRLYFLSRGCLEQDAEDLTQEVFLRIWRSKASGSGRFDPQQGQFGSWIYRIAGNARIDQGRKRKEQGGLPPEVPDPGTAEPASVDRQRSHALDDCLGQLSEEERVMVLLLLEGLTQTKIAEMLGISDGAVSLRLAHAREQLRQCMHEKGYS